MKQPRTKKDEQSPAATTPRPGSASAADNRVAQRHQKQSQAAQLSEANIEESPHMDRGDSAKGAGQSLSHGPDSSDAAKSLRRGAVDTQYGTKSSMKSGGSSPAGAGGGADAAKGSDSGQAAPNPGSSEDSTGAERDTMTTSRPGSGS